MSELEARTRKELEDIMEVLTTLTGLSSRWNGRVELVPEAEFKGKKRFTCDIQISAALSSQDTRWTTLIHESLHSFSAGYLRDDYQDFQGWEEGVVEQLQRLFRSGVLTHLNVSLSPIVFRQLDEQHGYNVFISALETIREALNIRASESEGFYVDMLATPLKSRLAYIWDCVFRLPATQQASARTTISEASATLRTRKGIGAKGYGIRG